MLNPSPRFITQTNIYSNFTPWRCLLNRAQPATLPPTVERRRQGYQCIYHGGWWQGQNGHIFLGALGRASWFMTRRDHAGLVETYPPLASIYTASTTGIHHRHITTPLRLVGDRTSGFDQSLTDSTRETIKHTCNSVKDAAERVSSTKTTENELPLFYFQTFFGDCPPFFASILFPMILLCWLNEFRPFWISDFDFPFVHLCKIGVIPELYFPSTLSPYHICKPPKPRSNSFLATR